MENTSYIALSRQAALRTEMSVVANNIANMNSTGYKASRMVFEEFLQGETLEDTVSLVNDRGTHIDWQPGPMLQTGNPLDMALRGDGFFAVETAEGIRYTRNGAFRLDDTGLLVTGNGQAVMDDNDQTITIPQGATDLRVTQNGDITIGGQPLARLKTVRFEPDVKLESLGNSLYGTDAIAQQLDQPGIEQGVIEQSNVNAISEMTRMIQLQRSYEQAKNMIDKEDQRQKSAIETLGSLA